MKKRIFPAVALLVLVLSIGAGFFFYRRYQAQFIDLGPVRYRLDITELDLSHRPANYLNLLPEFTNLKKLDLRGTGLTVDEFEQLHSQLPQCEILWELPFQGNLYSMDTEEIELSTLSQRDRILLSYLPNLTHVDASQCDDFQQLDQLRRDLPGLSMDYYVPICGKYYRYDSMTLDLSQADPAELISMLPYLPRLQKVMLLNPKASGEALLELQETYPQIDFSWYLTFKGIEIENTVTTLDLSGIPLTVEEAEKLIAYLPNLTYLDLSDCGISNEEMDALNRRHENIQIVWAVYLSGWFRVKTDITTFMPVKYDYYPRGDGLRDLRYCTELIAIDVGHMNITNCDFVSSMPHLQYLILADTPIQDLTPLTGLKELIYLEIFMTGVTDYSPLLTCTALQDLNLCLTHGKADVVMQMTWLKNLWWCKSAGYHFNYNERQAIRDALSSTNCNLEYGPSTARGWRDLPNYFAQRDLFGMPYMSG